MHHKVAIGKIDGEVVPAQLVVVADTLAQFLEAWGYCDTPTPPIEAKQVCVSSCAVHERSSIHT